MNNEDMSEEETRHSMTLYFVLALLLKGAYYWGAASGEGPKPVRPDTFRLWIQADYKF